MTTPASKMEVDEAPEECYNYIVTAHRPTAVLITAVGSLTKADDVNLIVSKCTRLEIHRLTPEGLQGIADVPIYGRLSAVKLFRPASCEKDLLLIATERFKFCILEWDEALQQLTTLASGDTSERIGQPCDRGHFVAVDPMCRAVVLHQYSGILRIIPMNPSTGALKDAFVARLEESQVIDLQFLHGCSTPTLAVLHEDVRSTSRSVKTYKVNFVAKDLESRSSSEGPGANAKLWEHNTMDAGASLLIPVQQAAGGGAIVVGETTITYCARGVLKAESLDRTFFRCWAPVDADGSRLLLGDHQGSLYLLVIANDGHGGIGLRIQRLGTTSEARAISYLDNGTCFIGSASGDSQLIRLSQHPIDPKQANNYIQILQSFTNLGPIVDFAVVDLDNSGQGQLVTCSGTGTQGSLRLVRNGIGLTEQASIDLQGIRGVWSMKAGTKEEHDKYLVLTFVEATHILAITSADELDEADIPGFQTDVMTLFCSTLDNDQICQVTATDVRVMDAATGALVACWSEPGAQIAKVAQQGGSHLLLATGQGTLYLLETTKAGINLVNTTNMNCEIACMDVAPWTQEDGSGLAAVGTWQSQVILLSVPSLAVLSTNELQTNIIPRSTLFKEVDGGHLILVGMGDGHLLHWQVQDNKMVHKKKVSLGMKPISLRSFSMSGQSYVFAASDRPTVVFTSNGKLHYSHLNENDISYLASFSSPSFPGALAIGKDNCLMISTIDAIQKLHIRSIPIGEQPRRIAHQPSTLTFGVVTIVAGDSSFVKVFSQKTWDLVASLSLNATELGNCICSLPSTTPGHELFVVGTAYVLDNEPEPTKGRVLLLSLVETEGGRHTLTIAGEMVLAGSVYQACALQDKILVTVNHHIVVLVMTPTSEAGKVDLSTECRHSGKTLAPYVAVKGNRIIVGDMMSSLAMYEYFPDELRIEMKADEFQSRWTTAVSMINDNVYMAAENSYNLFTLQNNVAPENDDMAAHLTCTGQYHFGDFINRIRQGSLVMQLPDSEFANAKMHIMATILGVISICVSIPKALHDQLAALETALENHIKGVGGLSHAEWRSYMSTNGRIPHKPCHNFLDGDLIEQLLDLPREAVTEVVKSIPEAHRVSVDDTLKIVEDLARLH